MYNNLDALRKLIYIFIVTKVKIKLLSRNLFHLRRHFEILKHENLQYYEENCILQDCIIEI